MEYTDDNFEKKSTPVEPVTSTIVLFAAIVCGVGGSVLQFLGIGYQTGSFFNYGTYALRVFNYEPDFVGLTLQIAIWLGLAVVLASICLGALALYRKRTPLNLCLFICVVLSLAMVGFGAGIIYLSSELDRQIQATGGEVQPGDLQSQISDYLLALYTECCGTAGFLSGDFDILEECTPFNQPTETETCFRDPELYTYYRRTANAWVCGELSNATVNLEGVLIPNTQFEATILTGGVTIVPIVGNNLAPVYGCGVGKALAFQYAFYVWADQNLKPVAIASVAMGVIQTLFLFAGCATICITNVDDELSGLSMFQETNPYNAPTFDPNAERRSRQIQAQEQYARLQQQQQQQQVAPPIAKPINVPQSIDSQI